MFKFGKKKHSEEEYEERDGRTVKRRGESIRNKKKDDPPKRREAKKEPKQPKKPWGKRERYLVLTFFIGTSITAAALGLSSRSWKIPGYPRISSPTLGLSETYKLEPERIEVEGVDVLIRDFGRLTQNLNGVYGFYVARLNEGVAYGVYADEPFEAASLIKLPVMALLYQEFEEGDISLSDTYRLRSEDKVSGSGSMQYAEVGTIYTYRELIQNMGSESDNTAFNIAVNILGEENVERFMNEIGMRDTSLIGNSTTPADIGKFYRKLWQGRIIESKNRSELLSSLTDTIYEEHLPVGVPPHIRVAHKYGREVNVVNDAGVVFADDPYVLVLMSKGVKMEEADGIIPELSKLVFEFEEEN